MDGLFVPLPDPASLPLELRESLHWIIWKAELHADGKKINKIPCDRAGQTASMKENHSSLDDALKSAKRLRALHGVNTFGVGLSFVEGGIVGVDLDDAIVDGVRAEHLEWLLENFATWSEVSVSGKGTHSFFVGSFDGKRNAFIDGKKIEIFGTTGFIAITGRQVPDTPDVMTSFYGVGEALKPFLEKVKKRTTVPAGTFAKPHNAADSAWGLEALNAQCELVRTAANGSLHYTLCSAATSLGRVVGGGHLAWQDAEQGLYAAAEQAGGKDMDHALRTIRGQLEFGMTDPAHPQDRSSLPQVDFSGFGSDDDDGEWVDVEEVEEESAPSVQDPGPFPEHLLKVPGFIGEVMEYTNQNSFVLQPILALGGALALMSVLTGRKIKDKSGTRTNAYILSVAASGEGKDMARRTNKNILFAAGAGKLVGNESWASGQGLFKAVEAQPAILFQNDETGRFLKTTNDANKSAHLYSIVSILLKLYSSSDSVFLGDAYADGRQTQIVQPHAVVFGTTVPDSLYAALNEDSVTNGLLGRFFVFEAPKEQQPTQEPEFVEPWDSIIETARKWFQWQPNDGNLGGINPVPFTVPTDQEADAIYREFRAFSRDQRAIYGELLGSLWVRTVENARKLGLLFACSVGMGEEARVTAEAAAWAVELTKHLVRRQCWMVARHVGNNQVEIDSMKLERIIAEAGSSGITGQQLLKKSRWLKGRDRREIVSYLLECDKVKASFVKTKGRQTTVYTACN